jgi:hypothetical protein
VKYGACVFSLFHPVDGRPHISVVLAISKASLDHHMLFLSSVSIKGSLSRIIFKVNCRTSFFLPMSPTLFMHVKYATRYLTSELENLEIRSEFKSLRLRSP